MSDKQADGESTLLHKLLLEEIDILLREHKQEMIKRAHKKLRDMARVGK